MPSVETAGAADLTYRRTLGGQFVREQGEHADKSFGLAMYTYDAQRHCYRTRLFVSSGQAGESTGKWDPKTETFAWISDAPGVSAWSRHRLVDHDTFEWDVVIGDGKDKVVFQMDGKANRAESSVAPQAW